jgi:peptidoglycan/LPS O-acetylase OafA/YrhL
LEPVRRGVFPHFLAYIVPGARLGDFVAGLLLYRLWRGTRAVSAGTATAFQLSALALLVSAYVVAPRVPQVLRYDVFYAVPMGLLILAAAWQQGMLAKWLSYPALVLLGEASFAMYLVHQLVIRAALGSDWPNAAYFIVSMALALALYRCFELPAKTMMTRCLRGMPPRIPSMGAN